MISTKWLKLVGVVGVLLLTLAACGGDDDSDADEDSTATEAPEEEAEEPAEDEAEEPEEEEEEPADGGEALSGSIEIDGSSTVAPLSEAAAELFQQENPDVQVTVATSGTGGGFERFCAGETDVSDASRQIGDDEIAACEEAGVEWEEVSVANDALAVLVNPENPVECLTVEQLNAIWGPDSTLTSWGEIEGLEPAFDEALDLYGPGTDSGTFDYFTDAINGEEGAQRTDYNNIGEDDQTGITGIQGSVGGMFYVGFSYYLENQDTAKALQVDGGDGCVEPGEETVNDGSYQPLGRQLFIYPSAASLERPEVLAFLEFYINNQAEITEAAGYIPMTDEQAQESLDEVASLAG